MQPTSTLSYNLPPTAAETEAAKKSAKKDHLLWVYPLAILIICGLVGWAYGAMRAADTPRLPTAAQLSSYVTQTNKDLAWCGATVTQVSPLLHTLLNGDSTPAGRLALSVVAAQGQGRCSQGTNGETNLGSIGPYKGYLGFNAFYWDADTWQTNDNATVLSDIALLSNNPTSTKLLSTLILDADVADSDVHAMRHTVSTEAGYIHMKNMPTVDVPTWNLTPASALALAPK